MKEKFKAFIKETKLYNLTRFFLSGIGSILMFHRICPLDMKSRLKELRGIEITPQFLEKIILFLKDRHCQFVSLDEVYKILRDNKKIRRNFAAFTFDDGYIDSLTLALPIFKKYSVPYAIFVNTSFADGTNLPWWYFLDELPDTEFSQIKNIITRLPKEDFSNAVNKILESHGINSLQKTKELMLNWEQIQVLSKDPLVTIGAHTVNHLKLNELDVSQARKEIAESKRLLELKIGKPVEYFAYPFGTSREADKREFQLAKECGFKMAFTTRMGNIFPEHKLYLESLPRISVNGLEEDIYDLDMNISGFIPLLLSRFKRIVIE